MRVFLGSVYDPLCERFCAVAISFLASRLTRIRENSADF